MSERIHELLLRNLQEVFGEGDSTKRRSAIKELYTDDCVVYVPPGILHGQDELDKFAGDLRATHPHFVTRPTILRRPSIMLGVSYGAPVLAAECLLTREWT